MLEGDGPAENVRKREPRNVGTAAGSGHAGVGHHQSKTRCTAARSRSSRSCPFCPGNERLTPPQTDVLVNAGGNWSVRAVPNHFPALDMDGDASGAHTRTPEGWYRLAGHGRHEVIIETPEHPAAQLRTRLAAT